jgi:hypothetical protein
MLMGRSPFDAALSSVYKSNSIGNPVRRGVGPPALFCLLKRDIRLCRLPDVLSLRCRVDDVSVAVPQAAR